MSHTALFIFTCSLFFYAFRFDLFRTWRIKEGEGRERYCPVFIEAKYSGKESSTYFTSGKFIKKLVLFLGQLIKLEKVNNQLSKGKVNNVVYLVFSAQDMGKYNLETSSNQFTITPPTKTIKSSSSTLYTLNENGTLKECVNPQRALISGIEEGRKPYVLLRLDKDSSKCIFKFFVGVDVKVDFVIISGKDKISQAFGRYLGNRPQYFDALKSRNKSFQSTEIDKFKSSKDIGAADVRQITEEVTKTLTFYSKLDNDNGAGASAHDDGDGNERQEEEEEEE